MVKTASHGEHPICSGERMPAGEPGDGRSRRTPLILLIQADVAGQLHSGVNPQFREDLPEVEVDRVPRKVQARCDFLVRHPTCDEFGDPELGRAETGPPEGRLPRALLLRHKPLGNAREAGSSRTSAPTIRAPDSTGSQRAVTALPVAKWSSSPSVRPHAIAPCAHSHKLTRSASSTSRAAAAFVIMVRSFTGTIGAASMRRGRGRSAS